MATKTIQRPAQVLNTDIGSIRRFGMLGPVYEVIDVAAADPQGRHQVRVKVIETGEQLDYPVDEMRADPGE